MIEVKDYSNASSVKSVNKGHEIKKFYTDAISTKLGFKFSGKDLLLELSTMFYYTLIILSKIRLKVLCLKALS